MIDRYQKYMNEVPYDSHAGSSAKKGASEQPEKKTLKMSSKVAPLVASLNEQVASKGGNHNLSEQEQLLRKNKKKANQQNRKQKQKQKKREDKQNKQQAAGMYG